MTSVKDLKSQLGDADQLKSKLASLEAAKSQAEEKIQELVKNAELQSTKHAQELAELRQQHQASLAAIQTENAEDAQSKISSLAQEIATLQESKSYVLPCRGRSND